MYYFQALTIELYGGKKQSTYKQQRKYGSAFGCREEENKNNLRALIPDRSFLPQLKAFHTKMLQGKGNNPIRFNVQEEMRSNENRVSSKIYTKLK